ncbi:MAG: polyprenyl synthetase family protein [Myxococcota bacterium]
MSELMETLGELGRAHMEEILGMIDEVARASTPEGSSLVGMNAYHMTTGGKRLRALLPLATAQCFGEEPGAMIPFGAACEMLHNATLVHDDLQDGDTVRRDQPTVWVKYGEARAINLGDAMLYFTLMLIDRLDVPASKRHATSLRLVRETLRVIDGQEREFLLKDFGDEVSPGVDAYFRMVEGKTSGLFALPVVGAAELCGAQADVLGRLQEATRHLGVIFQIQDDILDLFGDKGRGARGSDIGEGKISMLVVHALEHAVGVDAAWLKGLLRRAREDVRPEDITRAIALVETSGALAASLAELDRRAQIVREASFAEHPALEGLLQGMIDVFCAPIDSLRDKR